MGEEGGEEDREEGREEAFRHTASLMMMGEDKQQVELHIFVLNPKMIRTRMLEVTGASISDLSFEI